MLRRIIRCCSRLWRAWESDRPRIASHVGRIASIRLCDTILFEDRGYRIIGEDFRATSDYPSVKQDFELQVEFLLAEENLLAADRLQRDDQETASFDRPLLRISSVSYLNDTFQWRVEPFGDSGGARRMDDDEVVILERRKHVMNDGDSLFYRGTTGS